MRLPGKFSLAILLLLGGSAAASDITVYRCQDNGGRITLQDEPCPADQTGTRRSMTRPQDPPGRSVAPPASEPEPGPAAADADAPTPEFAPAYPPPPLFQCTDYDGEVRYSEDYDPNVRCVPLAVLGYDLRGAPQAANTCRWVQESCLRLDEQSACVQFKAKLKQARSDALHAFSDTAPFRKSELARLQAIVDESCR